MVAGSNRAEREREVKDGKWRSASPSTSLFHRHIGHENSFGKHFR